MFLAETVCFAIICYIKTWQYKFRQFFIVNALFNKIIDGTTVTALCA